MRIFPAGPYCFKQPTLADVLSNTAPPPYTLSAFMAYLSQNHCLETLEFTMDANRYRKHYNSIANPMDSQSAPSAKDCAYVRKLWQKLLNAYIVPNGPREVNLPCTVRDQILSIPNHHTPPPPESLDPAVDIVHELMQESVLVPFLSECQQTNAFVAAEPVCPTSWRSSPRNNSDESLFMRGSLDERMLRRRRAGSPPSPVNIMSNSYASGIPTRRTASPFSASLGWHGRTQQQSVPQSWTSNCSGDSVAMVDDSGSSTPSWGSPMTPPTTPPSSDAFAIAGSPRRAEKGWKRMTVGIGRGLGWGRKKQEPTPSYW